MASNILLEDTVSIFVNGIDEVNKVKSSLDCLTDAIGELVNFNEFSNLELGEDKVEQIKSNINNIRLEQKKLLNEYENSISELKKTQGNELNKLTKGMDSFFLEADNIRNKLKIISGNIEVSKIEEISTEAREFLTNIENEYKELGVEFKKISEFSNVIECLKKTVEQTNEKVKSENIGEKISSTQQLIREFQENYYGLNKEYEKLNEDIYNKGSKNIEALTSSIGKLYQNADEFHSKLLSLTKNIETEEVEKSFKDTNILVKRIYEDIEANYKNIQDEYDKFFNVAKEFNVQMEDIKNQWQQASSNFENLNKIEIYKDNIIEEIKGSRKTNKTLEDKIDILEEQIKSLSNENQILKEIYLQKYNEDKEFQKLILNEIKNLRVVPGLTEPTKENNMGIISNKIEKLSTLADRGDIEACFELAQIYHQHKEVEQELNSALKYYLKAANNGHNVSGEKIIEIYEYKAKQKNDVDAQYKLGEIYYKGLWGNKSNHRAFKYYEIAEQHGHMDAKIKAGIVAYDIGEGLLNLSVTAAMGWYKTAQNKGNSEAKFRLKELYNKNED